MTLLSRLARARTLSGPAIGPSDERDLGQGLEHCVSRWSVRPGSGPVALLGQSASRLSLPRRTECFEHLAMVAGEASPLLALDLETTGLRGEGNTVPFVVGLARYEDEQTLRCEQWTLRKLGAEQDLLARVMTAVGDHLASGARLLTFNGGSFDLPVLSGRLQRHRLADDATARWRTAHLDLLPVARRLWRDRGPDCRLTTLERTQLGVERVGDVPQADIPHRFWRALMAPQAPAAARGLADVRAHNALDLVCTVALLRPLATSLSHPADDSAAVRAARFFHGRGRLHAGLAVLAPHVTPWLEGARDEHPPPPWVRQAVLLWAQLHRRAGAREQAARAWRWVCACYPGDPEAHEWLAKDLEHRVKRPVEALSVARGSKRPCARRLARLERKASCKGPPTAPLLL